MLLNLGPTLTYLDYLIKQKLELIENRKMPEANKPEFFCITPEELKNYFKLLSSEENLDLDAKKIPMSLEVLGKLFHLSEFEKKALLIILAPEIDPKYERIYAYLQDDLTRKYPTISLISLLLCENESERLKIIPYFLPHSTFLKFRLIQFGEHSPEVSLLSRPLRLEASVRNFLIGCYSPDSRLTPFCKVNFSSPDKIKLSQQAQKLLKIINTETNKGKAFLFYFHGLLGSGRKNLALELAQALGYILLEVNTTFILKSLDEFEELLKIIFREALLSGALVYFDQFEAFFEHEKYSLYEPIFFNILRDFSWLTFCAGKKTWQPKNLSQYYLLFKLAISCPNYPESCKLWQKHLEEIDPELAKNTSQNLAQLFNFTQGEIKEVIHLLKVSKLIGRKINKKIVYDICREKVCAKLNHLAQRLKLLYTWKDIVLPQEQLNQLKEISLYYRHQYQVFEKWGFKKRFTSQGVCALFTGPPGTGKTMAAGIIAHELELDLYRIELSRIVSKYIGETEKNLAQIFDAAEGAGVILFFDEADALFGKRTEVKDAHDRYANIEVSYLLQRIEEYNGLVILASNFRRNIDEAFLRRMHFIVEFPFPDEKMRKEIWKKVFPEEAPLAKNIDFGFLAKNFKLSGGNIRNVALAGAFWATENSGQITMEHLLQGVKREYQKMGKSFRLEGINPHVA